MIVVSPLKRAHLRSNPIRRINHRKWLLSMHVTNQLHDLLMLSLVWQKKFTQSEFRMIHSLCSASNLCARAEKIKKPLFKQTHKVTFHIITGLGVMFSLSMLISKLSRAKIIGIFKLQVSL